MFKRFTLRARQVVVMAEGEARGLNHDYIGPEHILLGLLRDEDGVAAVTLRELGVTADEARAQIVGIVGTGEYSGSAWLDFTPEARLALEGAMREALALGHNYIGTEHVLLGLVRDGQGVAVQVLTDLGAPPELVRSEVISRIPPQVENEIVRRIRLHSPPSRDDFQT